MHEQFQAVLADPVTWVRVVLLGVYVLIVWAVLCPSKDDEE